MGQVSRLKARPKRIIVPPKEGPFWLRVNCAWRPREVGYITVDVVQSEAVDCVVDDLSRLPVDDGVVDRIDAPFYFHRLDNPGRWKFADECWRALKPNGQLTMIVPYWSSIRAKSDPLAKFPELCDSSFEVYRKAWREAEHMDLGIQCNFHTVCAYGVDGDLVNRHEEYRQAALKNWTNSIHDLFITMTAQK